MRNGGGAVTPHSLLAMITNLAMVPPATAQPAPTLTLQQKAALLQQNVKYVFVVPVYSADLISAFFRNDRVSAKPG
jgi:hypothetical protein